ncbi:MAG: hypothetical protein MJY78_00030 [Fibrobacter sp.]|nr:hypothetical protein [Fibrobacter sp.]
MKKLLSIQELKNSPWPNRIAQALGTSLLSAFVHGDCLMEGFSPFVAPWNISFILKEVSPEIQTALHNLAKDAAKENIHFKYYFTLKEILELSANFPLEFLHIANRNEVLCGQTPLAGYKPNPNALALQCKRELQSIKLHWRETQLTAKKEKAVAAATDQLKQALLPVLYGIFHLQTGNYPENKQQVTDAYLQKTFLENIEEGLNKLAEKL